MPARVDDGFGEGPRSLLRQVVSDAALDDPVLVLAGEFAGVGGCVLSGRAAAGNKDVGIGRANVIQQYLAAGLVDELPLHLAPVLLGTGKRLPGSQSRMNQTTRSWRSRKRGQLDQ